MKGLEMTKARKIELAKKAVGFAVKYGTGIIVHAVIKESVSVTRIDQRITVAMASYAIGGYVADLTEKYTDKTVDDFVQTIEEMFTKP